MKNNWKDLLSNFLIEWKGEILSTGKKDLEDFIESLLAEQKKELMGTFVNIVEKEQSKNYPFYDAKDGWREGRQEIAEDILESLNHHE